MGGAFLTRFWKVPGTYRPGCGFTYILIQLSKWGARLKNRLEELRRERGITQEELAAILEVSRQTISSLEKGRYNPSILLAFKIARCFGQSIEEIFLYEEDAQ